MPQKCHLFNLHVSRNSWWGMADEGSPRKTRKMANGESVGDEQENEESHSLVGISLTSEMGCHGNKEHDSALGFILMNVDRMTVVEMREAMQKQVESLPASFRFLTKQGWPVTSAQESMIKVKHLINDDTVVRIQPDYARPRVGVSTEKGRSLGFIFVSSLSLPISQLREAILAQLGGSHQLPAGKWVFVDRNFWPICSQQEDAMTIIDVLSGSCVRLHFLDESSDDPDLGDIEKDDSLSLTVDTPRKKYCSPTPRSLENPGLALTHGSIPRPISPIPHGDSFLQSKSVRLPAKQILISYVRAEASQYALDLKTALENLKFSVYLDVHEIFCGSDWQDSLNYAVSNCEVFVPLVTPRYGETQWTNRELKLADILNKYIIPVSFVETWPPCCLAIQFATTQFIHWRQGKQDRDKSTQQELVTYTWNSSDVITVSKDIGTRCLAHAKKKAQQESEKKSPILRSYPSALPPGLPNDMTVVTESREGAPMVVVCVHPKQKDFGDELKELFEGEGYEVWCTTELNNECMNLCSHSRQLEDDSTLILDGDDFDFDTTEDNTANAVSILQQKAAEAGVIVFVLSKDFASSDTGKQQVFYCEQRKRVVPLKYEEFEMPGWMSMLIGTSTLEDVRRVDYKQSLMARVKCALNPNQSDCSMNAAKESQIEACVGSICQKLPGSNCVYISGGTSFYYDKSEAICKEIGKALAKLQKVTLVTGGFFGVGETVSRSFYDERQRLKRVEDVYHILPNRDEQDRSPQARQNRDKTFQPMPFGETVFVGDSVRQRETIVSRIFDICILIEGGPGAAHEAEEFTWSDHTVIPIKCTGGAAGGKFNVPQKIFECPPGVVRNDWNQLADKNESPATIGAAVSRIITALQQDVAAQMTRLKTFVRRGSEVKT
ncbi:uncharacterized protein LOC110979851 isoform X2 [Acanthaster planci]|uniref:Uncharacterized protein LOC110979851 isoform X2 n=1 Tax=Acanthaster planci TaxID=133434 RepID=A0A8B7YJA3_ACAPL|nr:uncharacterized protein LOC110979851 isoform X2 [Acanthaster planci]